ncbi:MAG: PilZ domain-containing protein [Thermodesulfobacteriota bacterium]
MRKIIPRSKRVPFRVIVRYGSSMPPEYSSFIANISDTGVYLKTNRVFKPGTLLFMTIETDEKSFECEGIVSWARRVPPGLERITRCGMGIRFTKVPDELLKIYKEKL